MNWMDDTWPWYVAGPLLAGIMFALLFLGKQFGVSANLRTMCSLAGAGRFSNFFNINWKDQRWNLYFILGGAIGGYIAAHYMGNNGVSISQKTADYLENTYQITGSKMAYLPPELFSVEGFSHPFLWAIWIGGGLLVGFGARYAGGCTSGHAISGLSNLQWPSLIAVIGFFIGGLTMVHLLFPLLFKA